MNRYTTYLAGGALLASTALASGTVYAAATVQGGQTVNSADINTATAVVAKNVAPQFWGTTSASSTVAFSVGFVIKGSNTYSPSSTNMIITITGAEFDTASTPTLTSAQLGAGGSLTSVASIGSGVLTFSDKIILSSLGRTYTEVGVNASVKGAQALASSGQSVSIGGSIQSTSSALGTLENITTAAIVTSQTPIAFGITSNSTTADNSTTPAFKNFGGGNVSLTIGTVSISSVTGVSTNLSTQLTGTALISTAEIRITNAALADASLDYISIGSTGGAFATPVANKSGTAVSSGVATFTLATAQIDQQATGVAVKLVFTGSASIPQTSGSTSTVQVTPTAKTNFAQAISAQTLAAGNISRGGLNSSLNAFQNSFNPLPSLLRITNAGTNTGTYTVVLRQGDAAASNAGAVLGTYTGGTVAPNSTLQLTAATLETGAGLTAPTTYGNYTLSVSGTFNGYIQNLTFSPTYGVISNLSAFRNGAGTTANGGVYP